ncbi:SulP family inorganic anion transporter [Usitatibacter palustris]|uniref:C4-dicarboxylic acid transporter DauA n=1 Tax=Usitatibacter palustris TaxID=2732487 RepID=A0A6M4H1W5_9PROT|nr:SulP family inorganic anion transporter [Usitatibacter palustris]QJR13322.1 C4-dicarboxylic acid transporter DauA [Usitatibacter palustris]
MKRVARLVRFKFRPRLVDTLKQGYSREDFAADLASGVTVALIALPLAMAFGIASGVRPEQGIVTAIVAGLLISLLGGSRVQIGGPAGAFVALLYGIVDQYGVANLLIATMLAGVLLFTMGALKFGTLVRFVPVPIIVGFTAGIAVIIGLSQLRDFLGLHVDRMPSNFFSQIAVLRDHLHTANPWAIAVGLVSLLVIVVWPAPGAQNRAGVFTRLTAKLPATIVVLFASTLVVRLADLPVETIGSRFGSMPAGLPAPRFPAFDWATVQYLFAPTVAIALLGALESLLCARVADNLIDDRHDPDQELMAQGIANFIAPLFGGIAATGTIARTVTNVKSGARSPVAGIVHAITLLLIVVLLAPFALGVPLAALAAILLWVAFNMGGWREFRLMQRYSLLYRATMVSTFALTVMLDITVAVQVGIILSCVFFIYRMSQLTHIDPIALPANVAALPDGQRVRAWRVFGTLFFGSVTKLEALIDPAAKSGEIVLLDLDHVINMDNTGLEALEHVYRHTLKHGSRLVVVAPNEQPLNMMRRAGFTARLGDENLFATLDEALASLRQSPPSPT